MKRTKDILIGLLAFAGCMLCSALELSASIPETAADFAAEQRARLQLLVDVSADTATSEWADDAQMQAIYDHLDGKPFVPTAEWRAHLARYGLEYESATLEQMAAMRARSLRQVDMATESRWAILQEPGVIYAATPLRIIDGDTLDVRIDLEGDGYAEIERLRLYQIDTVERRAPGGAEAAAALSKFVNSPEGLTVWVPTRQTTHGAQPRRGKYGRLLAVLYQGSPAPSWETVADALYQLPCGNELLAKSWQK